MWGREFVSLDHGVTLTLRQYADGWGWAGWEQDVPSGGRIERRVLSEPPREEKARRFRSQGEAAGFFAVLAELGRDLPIPSPRNGSGKADCD